MAAFPWIGPTIFLLSGRFLDQFILTLGMIILAVVFGLTAFIFIRLFITWLQATLGKNSISFRRLFKRKTDYSSVHISEPEKVFLEPVFLESDGQLTATIFGGKSDISVALKPEKICENSAAVAYLY